MRLTDRGLYNLNKLYSKHDRPATNLNSILQYIRHRKNKEWSNNTLATAL